MKKMKYRYMWGGMILVLLALFIRPVVGLTSEQVSQGYSYECLYTLQDNYYGVASDLEITLEFQSDEQYQCPDYLELPFARTEHYTVRAVPQVWSMVPEGDEKTYVVDDAEIAVLNVSFTAERDLSDAEISVVRTISPPAGLDSLDDAYQYIQLSSLTRRTWYSGNVPLSGEDIGDVVIRFAVDKDWLSQQDANGIFLYAWSEMGWMPLETKMIVEDADQVLFEGFSDGPGFFAIAP